MKASVVYIARLATGPLLVCTGITALWFGYSSCSLSIVLIQRVSIASRQESNKKGKQQTCALTKAHWQMCSAHFQNQS